MVQNEKMKQIVLNLFLKQETTHLKSLETYFRS